MNVLVPLGEKGLPLPWANTEYLPDSKGNRVEIYLPDAETDTVAGMILMYYDLFGAYKEGLGICNKSWWDYCLDTWNPLTDNYDYNPEGKSPESRAYLQLLADSGIAPGFAGNCRCNDWDRFLYVALQCVVAHQAPYSPLFYHRLLDLFFYFHHTGSIGLYYTTPNDAVRTILSEAAAEYELR